jgi:Na+-translocating ferredoxin:NAD+ oxidoreductase RnfG subunit
MVNLETIVILGLCAAVAAVVIYFTYTKISSQNKELAKMEKRLERMEAMLTKPPSRNDLNELYRDTPSTSKCPPGAMCDLEPIDDEE